MGLLHTNNWLVSIALSLLAFICGSLPFSVWIGKLFLGLDVRRFGDKNPGAANVYRSGNKLFALLAMILDISKAAAPVGLAYFTLGMRGVPMYMVAMAPILGHVFSPFLGFRGGKGLATALGIWIGLTTWKVSLVGVVSVAIGIALFTSSGWAVMFAMVGILSALLFWMPDALMFSVMVSETLILAWTHRADLSHRPSIRPFQAPHFLHGKD
jgi:glycerol-3-phosphate acyltransferase PlsY